MIRINRARSALPVLRGKTRGSQRLPRIWGRVIALQSWPGRTASPAWYCGGLRARVTAASFTGARLAASGAFSTPSSGKLPARTAVAGRSPVYDAAGDRKQRTGDSGSGAVVLTRPSCCCIGKCRNRTSSNRNWRISPRPKSIPYANCGESLPFRYFSR